MRNEAFWVRDTIFSPRGRPQDAIGEWWMIHFDGEAEKIRAAKEEFPIRDCYFAPRDLNVSGDPALDLNTFLRTPQILASWQTESRPGCFSFPSGT